MSHALGKEEKKDNTHPCRRDLLDPKLSEWTKDTTRDDELRDLLVEPNEREQDKINS